MFIVVFIYRCGQKYWYSSVSQRISVYCEISWNRDNQMASRVLYSTIHKEHILLLMHNLTYSCVNCNLFHSKLRFFLEKKWCNTNIFGLPLCMVCWIIDFLWEEIIFFPSWHQHYKKLLIWFLIIIFHVWTLYRLT